MLPIGLLSITYSPCFFYSTGSPSLTTFVSTHAIYFSYSNCDGCSWFQLDSIWYELQPRNKESTCERFSPWFEVGESTSSSDLEAGRHTSGTDLESIRHTFNLAHAFCWNPVQGWKDGWFCFCFWSTC